MFIKLFILVMVLQTFGKRCRASVLPPNDLEAPTPVVTSSSSQYFQRIFSRLLVSPPVLEAPVFARVPAALPATPPPATTQTGNREKPSVSSVAFAVASAQAAPVATVLLPPYPFSQPQIIGFIPPNIPINVPETETSERDTEPTTESTNASLEEFENPSTSPSNVDGSMQGLPLNENVKFRSYLPPTPDTKMPEDMPVPLTYFTPPAQTAQYHRKPQQQYGVPRPHTPYKTKVIIRPVFLKPVIKLHPGARIILHKFPKKAKILSKYLGKLKNVFNVGNHSVKSHSNNVYPPSW